MLSLTGFKKAFTQNWWMTLLALLAIALFIRLGVWQLERADEKEMMLSKANIQVNAARTIWTPGSANPKNYQRVQLQGTFLPAILLLDNQHHQHQFGYHVYSPLLLDNQSVILIDRGWVAGDLTRRSLPDIFVPTRPVKVRGTVYYPPEKKMALGQILEKKEGNISVIEWMDTKYISHLLQKSIYPFIIRLGKNEKYGFVREWPVVSMPPQRHHAYALQWFAMAGLVLVIFIALNLKNKP